MRQSRVLETRGGQSATQTHTPADVSMPVGNLRRRIVIETTWLVLASLVVLAAGWGSVRLVRWAIKGRAQGESEEIFIPVTLCVLGMVGPALGIWISSLDAAAKVWFAPRLYIVEWLTSLL